MTPFIISRKTTKGFGGLNRFYAEFSTRLPSSSLSIDPNSLGNLIKLPFQKPSLIYLCDATLLPIGFILKTIYKKPLVVTAHGLDITFKNPIYQKMVRLLLSKTDAVVLDSRPTKKLITSFNLSQKAKVIPLGVSTNHLLKSKSTPLPNLADKIVLTSVGNLVERKGHGWFIKNVLPLLPSNYTYLIVGEGTQRDIIKQIIKQNNLSKRVFLLGQLDNRNLSYVLKKTDIYVSPNQHVSGNFESFGLAAIEAAALGIPVVSSNVDGIPDAIKNTKNGFLVKPKTKDFVKILLSLKNRQKRKIIGRRAKEFTLKNYSWDKTTKDYFTLFASFGKN